jgi:fermentation-respiration switch protein FrsA (DUF1100 family)
MLKKYTSLTLLLFVIGNCFSQQFLQLETINDPKSMKFSLGESLLVKTRTNDEWHKITLKEFLYTDSIILVEEGFLKVYDITQIRDTRPAVNAIARAAQTFGTAFIVYGFLGSLADNGQKFQASDAIIGGGAIAFGWAFKKAFYIRDYKMGSRYRLRLLDLRIGNN